MYFSNIQRWNAGLKLCFKRYRGNTKRQHCRNSPTMVTRKKAVYTKILFSAMHLFTRLRWPINFSRKLRLIFCCALCIPPWMSSLNIPLKAVCHIKLWEIQQFRETKACIVAFWVLSCFHSRTRVARPVWQNQTKAISRQVRNQSNRKTQNKPLQIIYCDLLLSPKGIVILPNIPSTENTVFFST